jgi:hypothetical protein
MYMALDIVSFILMLVSASALGFGLTMRDRRRAKARVLRHSCMYERGQTPSVARWRRHAHWVA